MTTTPPPAMSPEEAAGRLLAVANTPGLREALRTLSRVVDERDEQADELKRLREMEQRAQALHDAFGGKAASDYAFGVYEAARQILGES